MSNEVKIGLLAVVTIALSFWGYQFILGKNILVKSNTYYVVYSDVEELRVGTNVSISGVKVGSVATIELPNNKVGEVMVTLNLESGIRIPSNTEAALFSSGFMGGKVIKLLFDTPCTDNCAESGDQLKGVTYGMVESMVGPGVLDDYSSELKGVLTDVIDTLNYVFLSENSDSPIAKTILDLQSTMSNLNGATGQLNSLMRRSSGEIEGTLANLNQITDSLSSRSSGITDIIDNADALSQQLVEADLKQTISKVNQSLAGLKQTLDKAEKAMLGVNSMIGKINNGEGSLGKLIGDDRLYDNLNSLSFDMDTLIRDFQDKPYRYMPFKSRKKVIKFDKKDEALISSN